ncbi:hypothetical protein B0H14DRAFT_3901864 [Mycena olivaceomarginata]|nr:hypothetical protein B0H14DRAFT_3901864 [Mycena olivaceomarginata]
MNSDDDADLARAIALSMKEAEAAQGKGHSSSSAKKVEKKKVVPKKTAARKPQREVLVISSDEDEDDIVEVPVPRAKATKTNGGEVKNEETKPLAAPAAGAGPLSFLGDRAQMERERLARQKRVRGPSPPPAPPGSSGDSDDDDDSVAGVSGMAVRTGNRLAGGNGPSADSGPRMFPDGAILRIDTQHADASIQDKPECIRLSELLGPKQGLSFAVLSAFAVDPSWLYEFFDRDTPVVLVADSNICGAEASDVPTLKNIFPNWYVFVQDVPPAAPGGGPTTRTWPLLKPGESFPAILARALRATGVEEALAIMARQGHNSLPLPTLIPSALARSKHGPTPHATRNALGLARRARCSCTQCGGQVGWLGGRRGGDMDRQDPPPPRRARPRVFARGRFCRRRQQQSKRWCGQGQDQAGKWELELDCLTSSIGTYTPPWIAVFRLCAAGRAHGLQEWLDRGRKKTPPQGPTRVLFPTLETVRGTVVGEGGAGTVFCRRGQWVKIAALVADERTGLEMRDARSRSGGVGMHTKMILGTLVGPPEPEVDPEATESDSDDASSDIELLEPDTERRPHAWLYLGSHNFTPSAWGTLSGNGFRPVLNVTNYELGVVLRLETPEDAAAAVAWERPARRYGRGDLPWIQEESPFFQ